MFHVKRPDRNMGRESQQPEHEQLDVSRETPRCAKDGDLST